MVNIEFIKTTACPICGCRTIVSEYIEVDSVCGGKERRHCNGGKWEHRKFACGFHTHYIPNYCREETVGKCRSDPEEERKRQQRESLKEAVMKQIDDGDCPDSYKERLRQAIAYV